MGVDYWLCAAARPGAGFGRGGRLRAVGGGGAVFEVVGARLAVRVHRPCQESPSFRVIELAEPVITLGGCGGLAVVNVWSEPLLVPVAFVATSR